MAFFIWGNDLLLGISRMSEIVSIALKQAQEQLQAL